MRLPKLLIPCVSVLLIATTVLHAQANCSTLVREALLALDSNCADMTRNSACYGYNQVGAEFLEAVSDDYFSTPADRAALLELSTLTTAPLNADTGRWGVALMDVQASMPDSLPGQGAKFLLIGDAELENAVAPDETLDTSRPVDITTRVDANIRTGAGTNFNRMGSVAGGTLLSADARSADGLWYRVVYDDRPGFISADLITSEAAQADLLAALPLLDDTARTPMQAFYLRTGIGTASCEDAPRDTLMVQSPQKINLEFTVNGATLRIGSTVLFNTPTEDIMEITTLDGEVRIPGGGEGGKDIVIPKYYRSRVCLSEPDNRGTDGDSNDRVVSCPFSDPFFVPIEELTAEWCILQEVPISSLYYPVDLPCKGDPETRIATGNGGNTSGGAVGSCDAFRVLSPIGFSAFGDELFSWTAVTGADEYVINFQDRDGVFQQAQYVGNVTSTQYFAGSLPNGEFQWIVLALANQQILCSTAGSGIVLREANPDDRVPVVVDSGNGGGTRTVPFSISCAVAPRGAATISWSNLLASGNTSLSISRLGSFTSDTGTAATSLGFVGSWRLSPSGQTGTVKC